MSETKTFNAYSHASPEVQTERLELTEEQVDARFANIIEAEEVLAATDHGERERREATSLYKPSQGYDINSMKAAG